MKGYLPQIPYDFQCLASLTWSGRPPVCHPVTCGGLPTVANADYTVNTNTYQSTVTYTCAEGYRYGWMTTCCTVDPLIESMPILSMNLVVFVTAAWHDKVRMKLIWCAVMLWSKMQRCKTVLCCSRNKNRKMHRSFKICFKPLLN